MMTRRWPLFGSALAVAVVAATGAGVYYLIPSSAPAAGTFTITGQAMLNGEIGQDGTSYCWGLGGFTDIKTGAQVTVTDAAGTTVALGELGQGIPSGLSSCQFAFEVVGVPAGGKFYGIEVTHRGRVQYAEAALRDTEVVLKLSTA